MGTHYSVGQSPHELIEWAGEAVEWLVLKRQCNPTMFPVFCYSGMSGISYATALALEWERRKISPYGMIYVRKVDEKSHGASVEYNFCNPLYNDKRELLSFKATKLALGEQWVLTFVDDFIGSGKTRDRTIDKALGSMNNFVTDKKMNTEFYYVVAGYSSAEFGQRRF